ncbi:MAG: hypothetical protein CFE24_15085 [Flavobacterium sp. BFFFF2]|nr:MAG: hypothetical protein CFE24_15085 [Flavobacterium sp. BFFFF2]
MKHFLFIVCFLFNFQNGFCDKYYSGDWDGDGRDNIAVRRNQVFYFDVNFDGKSDGIQVYGNGDYNINGIVDKYFVGDWDGDGKTNVGLRRGALIMLDINYDGIADIVFGYGNGDSEDEYLVGDWDGNGTDNIAVRRGGAIHMDFNNDGAADQITGYGNGNSEDQYLVGNWSSSNRNLVDHLAIRRGGEIHMNFNFDGGADFVQYFGNGNSEDGYLVGDWDGDGKDNIAVLRGISILKDINFDNNYDLIQDYGDGIDKPEKGNVISWVGNLMNDLANGIATGSYAAMDLLFGKNSGFGNGSFKGTALPSNTNLKRCGDQMYDPELFLCCNCQSNNTLRILSKKNNTEGDLYQCDTYYRNTDCPPPR